MYEYLTDQERAKIAAFMGDPVAFEAVKKVLLAGVYHNGILKKGKKGEPLKNAALGMAFDPKYSNEALGADLRAFAQGMLAVENGFNELGKIAEKMIPSPVGEESNEAE